MYCHAIHREVIEGFRCKDTAKLWETGSNRRFANLAQAALRKLAMLDAAETLEDLSVPPATHLEALRCDRAGLHSIRINRQWRLCFRWREGRTSDVEITDYH